MSGEHVRTIFGAPVRLLVQLSDGEHDVTNCLRVGVPPDAHNVAVYVDHEAFLLECEIEKRTRARITP